MVKKKKGKVNPYAVCKVSTGSTRIQTVFNTFKEEDHNHKFRVGDKQTRMNYDHIHPIDYKKGIALSTKKAPHEHKLPKAIKGVFKLLRVK